MSTAIVYETGLTCDSAECGGEFRLGEEILYYYGRKLHQSCAAAAVISRRSAAGEDEDVLVVARRQLEAGGRVILTRRQLRGLIALACAAPAFTPVRRPDAGTGRRQWYGRMNGWSASRVAAGLAANEVTGLWLDFLDAGRIPPLRASDLSAVMQAIAAAVTAA